MSSVKAAYRRRCSGVVEAFGEHEVDVAVLGVPEDHAVLVAVPVEQLGEPVAGVRERSHRHGDVLEQCGRAGRRGRRRRWCTAPCGCATARPGPRRRRSARPAPASGSRAQHRPAAAVSSREPSAAGRPGTRPAARRARSTASARDDRRSPPGRDCATRSDVASSSSMVAGAGGDQRGQRAGGRRTGRRRPAAPVAACRSTGTVRNDASATNAERALAADDQVRRGSRRAGSWSRKAFRP